MKKIILFVFSSIFIYLESCGQAVKREESGSFLFTVSDKIVYYNFNSLDGELDESTPVNLVVLDIKNRKRDTLLTDNIYWDCFPKSDSSLVFTDGRTIFSYNLYTKRNDVLYRGVSDDDDVVVNRLWIYRQQVYFFETDYVESKCRLKKIVENGLKTVYEMAFSELESPDVKVDFVDQKLVFQLQNFLCQYDVFTNDVSVIDTSSIDFAVHEDNILYACTVARENSQSRVLIRKHDQSKYEKVEISTPFNVTYNALFSQRINGKKRAYFINAEGLYFFNDGSWSPKRSFPIMVYSDSHIEVSMPGDNKFNYILL